LDDPQQDNATLTPGEIMPGLQLLQEFPLKGRVWRVALHPAGSLAIVASYFEIGAWELPSGKLLWKEPYNSERTIINSMALSPNGQNLAVSFGLELQVRDPLTGTIKKRFSTKERYSFTRMTFSRDGGSLWTGSKDVMRWSLDTNECTERFIGPKNSVCGISLNASGDRIAVAADKSLWLWEPSNPKPLRRYPIARFGMTAVSLSPDGSCAWTTDTDNHASLWSLKKAKKELLAKSEDLGEGAHELVADPQWRWILASGQAQMTLFDAKTGATLSTTAPANHQKHRWADDLCMSQDGTLILSAHIDEAGRLWEIKP
jgi:WD40 repeat protein